MVKSNVFIIAFFSFITILTVGVTNIEYLHNNFEAEVEECIEEGGGYECFFLNKLNYYI